MEKYLSYKDSGVQWLGEIPSHWKVKKIRHILSLANEKTKESGGELLSLSQYAGVTPKTDSNVGIRAAEDTTGYNIVHKGQFVMNIMLAWNGSYAVSEYDGIISPAYCVFDFTRECARRYYNYLLRMKVYSGAFKTESKGIIDSRLRLYPQYFKNFPLIVPPIEEQRSMATYLDKATAEIDRAIAQQQRMIDLLNERKQIIIQRAVTKGLDENVEMKNSGLNWLGQIPSHWELVRLGYSSWIRARLGWRGLKANEYVDSGYVFLSAFNIVNNKMQWDNVNFINKFRYDESPEIKLKIGDILLVKDGAGIGKCARVDELPLGEATANGSLAFITPKPDLDYRYLHYFLICDSFKKYTELLLTGMGVPHFTQGAMKKVKIPIPPINEQKRIVFHLDKEVGEFDLAIGRLEKQISFLQERKQIIISEVVTGKIKVS